MSITLFSSYLFGCKLPPPTQVSWPGIGSPRELCLQSPCIRNGQVLELRKGPLLHPNRCPADVISFANVFKDKVLSIVAANEDGSTASLQLTVGERTVLRASGNPPNNFSPSLPSGVRRVPETISEDSSESPSFRFQHALNSLAAALDSPETLRPEGLKGLRQRRSC